MPTRKKSPRPTTKAAPKPAPKARTSAHAAKSPRPKSPRPKSPPSPSILTLRVDAPAPPDSHSHVLIGCGVLRDLAALCAQRQLIRGGPTRDRAGAALLIVDAHLPRDLVEPVIRGLDRLNVRWGVCVQPATEADKSLASVERALAEAASLRLDRHDTVIALGGGIVTDLAGLVAGLYRRGIRVVQCPTTLLAMVDAAVGGKTAANISAKADDGKHRLIKNALGVFHHPALVLADVLALASLPPREFRCGLAECLKHAILADPTHNLDPIEHALDAILAQDPAALAGLVRDNIAFKAAVVADDPREERADSDGRAGRMALNLGHTFAHAIETLPGLSWLQRVGADRAVGPLKHGEAVALGLLAAARVGATLGLTNPQLPSCVETLLARIDLPIHLEGLPPAAAVIDRMADDKKAAAGRVRLILPADGKKRRGRLNVKPAKGESVAIVPMVGPVAAAAAAAVDAWRA